MTHMLLNLNMSVAMNGLRTLIFFLAVKDLALDPNRRKQVVMWCTESRERLVLCGERDPRNCIHLSAYFSKCFSGSMYQQFSATAPPDYGQTSLMGSLSAGPSTVAPHITTTTTLQQKPPPLVATGDWAHELVQLAKTAELKWVLTSRPVSDGCPCSRSRTLSRGLIAFTLL